MVEYGKMRLFSGGISEEISFFANEEEIMIAGYPEMGSVRVHPVSHRALTVMCLSSTKICISVIVRWDMIRCLFMYAIVYMAEYAVTAEIRRVPKLMFRYISPFDTTEPTDVPKSVRKIRKNIVPPKIRFALR